MSGRDAVARRDWLFPNCSLGAHDWKSIGGANAGCSEDCRCSVPVHVCTVCGDCDYGENVDGKQVREECAEEYPWMSSPTPSLTEDDEQ